MSPVDPGFRYPGELPPPKKPDWPFLALIGAVTVLILLGWLCAVAKMAGWSA